MQNYTPRRKSCFGNLLTCIKWDSPRGVLHSLLPSKRDSAFVATGHLLPHYWECTKLYWDLFIESVYSLTLWPWWTRNSSEKLEHDSFPCLKIWQESRFLSPAPGPGYPQCRVLPQASGSAWLSLLMESVINSFPDFQPHKFPAWTFNKVRSGESYIWI